MKQRQRSGLVTPQMGTANSLPLTSPQPLGQSMQQQQQIPQSVGSNPSITPAHHHRTLSQSSNMQPQVPRPMPQQQQQQPQQGQQQMHPKEGNGNPVNAIHGMTEENLLKVAISMAGKMHGPQVCRRTLYKRVIQEVCELTPLGHARLCQADPTSAHYRIQKAPSQHASSAH